MILKTENSVHERSFAGMVETSLSRIRISHSPTIITATEFILDFSAKKIYWRLTCSFIFSAIGLKCVKKVDNGQRSEVTCNANLNVCVSGSAKIDGKDYSGMECFKKNNDCTKDLCSALKIEYPQSQITDCKVRLVFNIYLIHCLFFICVQSRKVKTPTKTTATIIIKVISLIIIIQTVSLNYIFLQV